MSTRPAIGSRHTNRHGFTVTVVERPNDADPGIIANAIWVTTTPRGAHPSQGDVHLPNLRDPSVV